MVKIKKRTKKAIWIIITIIIMILTCNSVNYIFVVKPIKDNVIRLSKEYLILSSKMFILPLEYQNDNTPVPNQVINEIENKVNRNIDKYIDSNSELMTKEKDANKTLIDMQVKKQYIFNSITKQKVTKVKRVNIDGNKASVIFTINTIEDSLLTQDGKTIKTNLNGNSTYTIGLKRIQGVWKIYSISYDL